MTERANFEMTEAQLNRLYEAMKPVPVIMLQCRTPLIQQQNANRVWAELGLELGFAPITVLPNGKGDRFFSAVPVT